MQRNASFLKRFLFARSTSVLLVLILIVIFFTVFSPEHRFVDPDNLRVLLSLGAEFSIIALGVGMLMICGEFDLSIGSILVFCSFVFLKLFELHLPLFLTAVVTVAVGGVLGLVNALITVRGGIPSFITTLGTMMFWRGFTILLSGGEQTACDVSALETPAASYFLSFFNGQIGGILPAQFFWFALFAVVLGVLLHYHRFGNWVYATGDNRDAARAMGINTDWVKTLCFVIVGALCGFVACMQSVRIGSFAATQGIGMELRSIAACVVGGTSLRGGVGSMSGVTLGALTIPILDNGLILLRVPVFGITAFIGLATILFVVLNTYVERRFR
jgi:simple sugar transport system permease protein